MQTLSDGSLRERFMLHAVELAEQAKGLTAPNPCVGALLTSGERILASGLHTAFGRPHAEVEAIEEARRLGVDTRRASLWVTLEPCNHQGLTPPCTRSILEAGIRRVFVGTRDPNPEVRGGGAEFLRSRGVEVEVGIAERACRDLIADFLLWRNQERPYVWLKLASTLDGKIAAVPGRPARITGAEAGREVHRLRARSDGVLIGGGTLRADDPRLTCRFEPLLKGQPLAAVVTSRLPDPGEGFTLMRERAGETVFLTGDAEACSPRARSLQSDGASVWGLPARETGLDLHEGLRRLRQERGCFYLLCEGGGRTATGLMRQGLADELHLYLAPRILGDERSPSAFSGREVADIREAWQWRFCRCDSFGNDMRLLLRPHGEP